MDDVTRLPGSQPVPSGAEDETRVSGAGESGAAQTPCPRPLPGEAFGPYIIERPLGRGGMGDVYEAHHIEHARRVALKILGQRLAGPGDRARFLREGELAASITHPNTVYVYGSEEISGSPVITMELLPGGTLKDLVQTRGPLPPREAVDLILPVIAGLRAAQTAGILHRDVKPANCFVDRDGSVKVGDFGLSISTAGHDGAGTGLFQGTPQFAAPEQIRGEALDVRADIYAVGATLFYLLTGKAPFDDTDLTTLITQVQVAAAESVRQMRAGVPQALADLVSRCLGKDRDARPASYGELEDALRPFGSAAPTPAGLGWRTLAGAIDYVTLTTIITPASVYLVFHRQQSDFRFWVSVVQILSALTYFGVLEGLWGAGLGKVICGLSVMREGGQRPGAARATGRALIYQCPALLGLIPMVAMGAQRFAQFTFQQPWTAMLMGVGLHAAAILLFLSARRRNGFAAVQDLATGTRVVRRAAASTRAGMAGAADAALDPLPSQRRCGPFDVIGTLGQTNEGVLLAASDPRLKRRVWIHERPVGAPPIPPLLRDLGRPGRLRWLGGRRTATEAWDAYEALDGGPLTTIDAPQPWRVVKRWLLDLAIEAEAGLADDSLPPLTLDRVWVTRAGHARLLDFVAPGVPSTSEAGGRPTRWVAQGWLSAAAERGLTGRTAGSTSAASPRVLPLSARTLLDRLAASTFETSSDVVTALVAVLPKPDSVAGWRRAWSVALGGLAPVFLAVLGLVVAVAMRTFPSGVEGLAVCLSRLSELSPPGHEGEAAERAAIEIYVAARYGQTIANDFTWAMIVDGTRMATYRPIALQAIARHPAVTPEELAAASAALGPLVQAETVARVGAARRAQAAPAVVPTFLFVAGFAIAAAFGILFAAVFRSGLLLRGFGLAVVTRSGQRASRRRATVRALVAWAPAIAFAGGLYLSDITFRQGTYHARYPAVLIASAAAGLFFLAGALLAALRPARGCQDYVAGTWLVPR